MNEYVFSLVNSWRLEMVGGLSPNWLSGIGTGWAPASCTVMSLEHTDPVGCWLSWLHSSLAEMLSRCMCVSGSVWHGNLWIEMVGASLRLGYLYCQSPSGRHWLDVWMPDSQEWLVLFIPNQSNALMSLIHNQMVREVGVTSFSRCNSKSNLDSGLGSLLLNLWQYWTYTIWFLCS